MTNGHTFSAAQIRIARPTDRFAEVLEFYRDALGLPVIGSFNDHDGYEGVMLRMPDAKCHLEFTQHIDGSPCPAPTHDNLLVFYYGSPEKFTAAVAQIESRGHQRVKPENSYWADKSYTYQDPDGWRVVLFNGTY